MQPIQPAADRAPRRFLQGCAMSQGIGAHRARVDAGLGQLAAMADEPALDLAGVGLQVELQAQHRITDRVGLMRTALRAGQQPAARGKIEAIGAPLA